MITATVIKLVVWGAAGVGLVVGLLSFIAGRPWWYAFSQGYACALILIILLYTIWWVFAGLAPENGGEKGKRLDISIGDEEAVTAG